MKRSFLGLWLCILLIQPSLTVKAQTPTTVTDPWLGGNAVQTLSGLPFDENGTAVIGLVPIGYEEEGLLVAIKNLGSQPLYSIEVVVEARTSDGQLFAVGEPWYISAMLPLLDVNALTPVVIAFENVEMPADIIYDVKWTALTEPGFFTEPNLKVLSANHVQDRIVGEVENLSDNDTATGYVTAICFSESGSPTGLIEEEVAGSRVPAYSRAVFQINLPQETGSCSSFVIVGKGSLF
jgi:hypothetical protein